MVNIEHYLNDGVGYQAQMVLCYLRGREIEIAYKCRLDGEPMTYSSKNYITIGQFENGCKQGYIFGINARGYHPLNDKWMIVEKIDSDTIWVRHFKDNINTIVTPRVDIAFNDEYLVNEEIFKGEDIMSAGNYIFNGMRKVVNDYIESPMFQNIVERHNKEVVNKK